MPTIHEIGRVVAEAFAMTLADLQARNKEKRFVIPRIVVVLLAKRLTNKSLQQIGRVLCVSQMSVYHSMQKDVPEELLWSIWHGKPDAPLAVLELKRLLVEQIDRDLLDMIGLDTEHRLSDKSGLTRRTINVRLRRLAKIGLVRDSGLREGRRRVWVRAGWAA